MQNYQNIRDNVNIRKKTFAKFAFKSNEKDENIYLKPVIQSFNGCE